MNVSKIKIFNFSLIPVLLLATLFFISIARKNNTDIDYARKMMNEIKHLRVSIDTYYLKTGEFPDFSIEGVKDNLTLINYKLENGEEVNFANIYGAETLVPTPEYKNLMSSNQIYEVSKFKDVSNNGGWNYNKKTGEIHINLPYNFFEQGIDWNSF